MEAKKETLSFHRSQEGWLQSTQGTDTLSANMEKDTLAVGKMSGKFKLAEGWTRHLYLATQRGIQILSATLLRSISTPGGCPPRLSRGFSVREFELFSASSVYPPAEAAIAFTFRCSSSGMKPMQFGKAN